FHDPALRIPRLPRRVPRERDGVPYGELVGHVPSLARVVAAGRPETGTAVRAPGILVGDGSGRVNLSPGDSDPRPQRIADLISRADGMFPQVRGAVAQLVRAADS